VDPDLADDQAQKVARDPLAPLWVAPVVGMCGGNRAALGMSVASPEQM